MNVHIMFAKGDNYANYGGYLTAFKLLVTTSKSRQDVIVENPNNADLVLVIDSHLMPRREFERCLNSNSVVKHNLDRVFVYDETDNPASSYRGLFVSMPRLLFKRTRHSSSVYWGMKDSSNQAFTKRTKVIGFRGDCTTHSVRRKLKTCATDGLEFYDTSDKNVPRLSHPDFIQDISNYEYFLCPRGYGTASIRMFECMSVATVPIVISDDYVMPAGLVHGENCLVVPESTLDLSTIHSNDGNEMSKKALSTHSRQWSEETRWGTYVEELLKISSADPVVRSQYFRSVIYYKVKAFQQRSSLGG